MSKIDDERLGLGWEVWFLLAILCVGGVMGILVPNIIGIGFEAGATSAVPREAVTLEWPRVVSGMVAFSVFMALAVRIIRTIDWHLD